MKYYAKIGNSNTLYDVYPNVKVVDKLSEELDMVEFTLKPIDYELDLDFKNYNGLIMVTLFADDVVYKYLYLSFYKCVNVAYSPNKMYKYVFQCVSPTFNLQRITLPNKLITQPISDTKRTIYEEIIKIRDVYCDWLELSSDLETLLNVPCPQMQFTKSTLHEILISLFAVVNLVPKMLDYDMLGFLSLEGTNNKHHFESIIRIEKQNSVDNYCDALDYDIENAISDGDDITTTWLAPTGDEAMLTTENFLWKMPSDIYEIIRVEAMADIKIMREGSTDWEEIKGAVAEITDYVLPKVVWDTYRSSSNTDMIEGNYKRNYLYYDTNKIYGNYSEENWLGRESTKSIQSAFYWYFKNIDFGGLLPNYKNVALTSDFRHICLKVTYKSEMDNSRIAIVKKGVNKPENFMISNQDDAYIDATNFGKQKQEFINRLGNEVATGQANFENISIDTLYMIPNLGDWVEDYIITQREMLLKENNILINYQLTKDYVLKTGYSGLNQMKRFTSIDTENTMIRNDLILFNYQFSFKNKIDDYNNHLFIAKMIINNYGKESKNGKNLHLVKTLDKNNNDINGKEYQAFLVNAQNKFIANFITSQFKFETNAKVGDYILIEDDTKAYSKIPVRYVDNNGEFKNIRIYFAQGEEFRNIDELSFVLNYPIVSILPERLYGFTKLINKDNREITAISMQFRTISNKDEGIFVYDNFLKHCDLYPHNATNLKVFVKWTKTEEELNLEKYNENTNNVIGEESNYANVVFNADERSIEFMNVLGDYGHFCIGLVDKDNKLLLGINYANNNASNMNLKIYLNNYF